MAAAIKNPIKEITDSCMSGEIFAIGGMLTGEYKPPNNSSIKRYLIPSSDTRRLRVMVCAVIGISVPKETTATVTSPWRPRKAGASTHCRPGEFTADWQ